MLYKSRNTKVVDVKEPIVLCGLCKYQPHYKGFKCVNYSCRSVPKFNYEGLANKAYCKNHSTDEMVNKFANYICKRSGCKTQSNYNVRGLKVGLYCLKHKLDGMVDVINKRCVSVGCETIPYFNVKGLKVGLYCVKHKLDGMIDIKNKICITDGCYIRPQYNLRGLKNGLYCVNHKLEGMVYVIKKSCVSDGCETIPSFNVKGLKVGLYCVNHKLEGMVDVINKRCVSDGCETIPYYNVKGLKVGLYCVNHKLEGMVDVKSKMCRMCDTIVHTNNKYRGYCVRCFIHTFPTENVSRNYKTKERNVVDIIKQVFPYLDWKEDMIISCGCSKRRPDMFLDLAIFVIVIEIDENQHTDYDSNCETKRMMEISQDVGGRPVVFIRFNPDDYKIGSVKITSCWGVGANGLSVVKKCKIKEWKERTDALNNQIQFCIDNPSDKMIDVIHMFYDSL